MATKTLVPSSWNNAASRYVTITNPENAYTDTSSTTYATLQNTTASTSSRYVYLCGFNFDSVPSGATVTSFTIKIKGYYTGGSQQTLYLCNGTTTQTGATATGLTTTTQTRTFSNGSLTWNTISGWGDNFGIRINARRGNRNTVGYYYIHGAEIDVTYTEPTPVAVTGVDVSPSTASIEVGETATLTATVSPSTASNKSVTWSTSASSVATVSGGVVTGVSAGTARITATTVDGGYTDYCDVTVTPVVTYEFVPASSMQVGKQYLITDGNSGTVHLLTGTSAGSRLLQGVTATVSNGKISITGSVKASALFDCVRYTAGNDNTITVSQDNKYLYSDNSTGLRMNAPATLDRFWHFRDNKFWQFKSTTNDGYTDTSSEYKYYLQVSNGNYTDNHVTSPSIEDTNIPLIYIWVESTGQTDTIYFKDNGSWVAATKVYKKVNGSWVEQTDLTNVFDSSTNYVKGN